MAASASPNRALVGRAAAILTTGEVAGASLILNEAWGSELMVDLDFTLGSLTNVVLRFYASMDGTTWVPITDAGAAVSQTLTATATKGIHIKAPGYRYFRMSAQGTGTVTSSSLAFTYRYLRRGSQ